MVMATNWYSNPPLPKRPQPVTLRN